MNFFFGGSFPMARGGWFDRRFHQRQFVQLQVSKPGACVNLKAAKEALLRVMPDSKAKAMSPADLFRAAIVPSRTTGNRALRELLSAGKIQRIGEPRKGYSCRYFASGEGTAE